MFKDGDLNSKNNGKPVTGKNIKLIKGVPPAFAKQNMLEGFQPQKRKQDNNEFQVKENKHVKKICGIFPIYLKAMDKKDDPMDGYDLSVDLINLVKKKGFSSKDIELFCYELKNYESISEYKYHTGIFISALMNLSKDKKFTLYLGDLTKDIFYIGYLNADELIINGDVGSGIGDAQSGMITLNGDLYGNIHDQDGTLIINGNVLVNEILPNESSKIEINGNIEYGGTDGRDYIFFEYGNIFQRGRQIVDGDGQIADIINE